MAKEGLTKKRFEAYTSVIEEETNDYVKSVGRGAVWRERTPLVGAPFRFSF